MDEGFRQSFKQGNRTMDIVREILWRTFTEVADMNRDLHENTDLILKTPFGDVEISVRIRTNKWYEGEYKYQFTLCCHRNSGSNAEWQKIFGNTEDGKEHGKYIFYGFENKDGTGIVSWFIGDLDIFRKWWRQGRKQEEITFKPTSKDDRNIGCIKRKGVEVGRCFPVRRVDAKTGNPYYDYMYAFDRRAIPDFVIADSDHWKDGD